ncbi:MAG TPA: UvrD-helicase domain-containing protein [Clostridia bacterium]
MRNWTPAQLRAIKSNSDKILVSASSGSGKTSVMIARIVYLIVNKKASVDNILVTTFTNAAAQDMKAKLIEELSTALQNCQDKEYLLDQLQSAETAQICTLHSFCGDLIRKYYYAAGVDSAFSVIQDLEASLKKSKAIKKVFQEYLDSGDQIFLRLYDIFTRRRKDKNLAKIINQIYDFYRTLPKNPDWLCVPADLQAAEEYIQDYKKLADGYYIKQLEKIIDHAEAIGYEPAKKAAQCVLEGIFTGVFPPRLPSQNKPEDCDEQMDAFIEKSKDICKKARDFYVKFNNRLSQESFDQELAAKLLEITGKFAQKYDELKKEDFELDFADLEHYAYEILNNEQVREEIKQKYKYIFVDEFQDINPMQEAIISLFEGSKMFFVGDVKQSIYRFRLCDPDIFIKKYKDFKSSFGSSCEAIDLNDNFRSAKSILAFNNEIFSRVMTADIGGVDYDNDARFVANNPDLESEYPTVNIVIGRIPQKEKIEPNSVYSVKNHINHSIVTSKKAEADIIINEIGKILETGRVKKDGKPCKPEFSDIVILFRSLSNSLEIINEISKVYPVSSGLETELLARPEILMLIDYIKVLDNYYQDISLTGALKSVFGRLDDNELIRIRERYPKTDFYYQAVLEYRQTEKDEISQKLNEFFANIEQDKKYASCHSLNELLLYIITKYNYEEYLLENFEQADYEYVELFLELAAQYKTVQEFLDYIDNGEISPSIEMPAKSAKAIRIMTIHQSKGLEFPIVFVCGLGARFKHSTDEILIDQRVKLGLKHYDYQNRVKAESKTRAAVSLLNKRKEIEEEMRVLYVAMTRAKYHLTLTGTIRENYKPIGLEPFEILNAQSFLDWILAVLARDKDDKRFNLPKSERIKIEPCYNLELIDVLIVQDRAQAQKPILSASDAELEEKIKQNIEFKYLPNGLNQKYTVTELNAPQEPAQSAYIFKDQDNGGIDRGNAYHTLMKYIDFNRESIEDINDQIRLLKAQGLLSDEYISLIEIEKIQKALKSDILNCAKQNKYYREREFLYYADAQKLGLEGGGKVLVQGVIDLMIFTDEGVIIVDYKTTKGGQEHLINLYKNQLEIYAQAAEDILGENVVKKVIYSFDEDKEIIII